MNKILATKIVKLIISIVLSLVVSTAVVNLVLDNNLNSDLYNYIASIDRYDLFAQDTYTVVDFVINEMGFYYLLSQINSLTESPVITIRVLVFSIFLLLTTLIQKNRGFWVGIILIVVVSLHPVVLQFVTSQIRSSLAIALFFWGLSRKRRTYKYLFIAASITMHIVVIILFFVYVIWNSELLNRTKLSERKAVIFSLALAVLLVSLKTVLLNYLNIEKSGGTSGLLYTLMWFLVALLVSFTLTRRRCDYFLFIALFSNFCGVVSFLSDDYGSRFFAIFSVSLVLSSYLSSLTQRSSMVITSLAFTNIISYYYWIGVN